MIQTTLHISSANLSPSSGNCLLAEAGNSGGAPAGGLTSLFEGLKSSFGQSSQSAGNQGLDQASTPAPAGGEGAPQAVSTALEGNPSPSPSLTAGIEAETDKNSEKPAVQALIDGVSLYSLLTADCGFLYLWGFASFLLVERYLLETLQGGACSVSCDGARLASRAMCLY